MGLLLFEVANVYFIMPMPGKNEQHWLCVFLYNRRWAFRCLFGLMVAAGFLSAFRGSKVAAVLSLLFVVVVTYAANYKMAAGSMFLPLNKERKGVNCNLDQKFFLQRP